MGEIKPGFEMRSFDFTIGQMWTNHAKIKIK